MTLYKFFKLLKKHKTEWYFDNERIYTEDKYHEYCPITWVAKKEINLYYPLTNFIQAGKDLGLSKEDTLLLAMSNDHNIDGLRKKIIEITQPK